MQVNVAGVLPWISPPRRRYGSDRLAFRFVLREAGEMVKGTQRRERGKGERNGGLNFGSLGERVRVVKPVRPDRATFEIRTGPAPCGKPAAIKRANGIIKLYYIIYYSCIFYPRAVLKVSMEHVNRQHR
ncbi:hypothetical protein PUN28_016040 [Cardiocondyla obscurior]|uniref:Uncharacterized protein n=1 Tax=Cardiocondyla obscurior TaxID=286306 RepID=A0AAW2EUD0_9HYME